MIFDWVWERERINYRSLIYLSWIIVSNHVLWFSSRKCFREKVRLSSIPVDIFNKYVKIKREKIIGKHFILKLFSEDFRNEISEF